MEFYWCVIKLTISYKTFMVASLDKDIHENIRVSIWVFKTNTVECY